MIMCLVGIGLGIYAFKLARDIARDLEEIVK